MFSSCVLYRFRYTNSYFPKLRGHYVTLGSSVSMTVDHMHTHYSKPTRQCQPANQNWNVLIYPFRKYGAQNFKMSYLTLYLSTRREFVKVVLILDTACHRDAWEWESQWEWESHGNHMGMGQKLNKQWGWEWEWESIRMGMGMTPIPMGMDSHQRLRKIVVEYSN